jgi:fucose permease
MLGPLLPTLAARWTLNDVRSGNLFLAQYVGSIGGMLVSGLLVRRHGYRLTLLLGALLMTSGVTMLASADLWLGFVAIVTLGFGYGLTTPTANLFISNSNPENRASALTLLNSTWGVGAMSSPLLVGVAERTHQVSLFFYALTASLGLLAVTLGTVRFLADETRLSLPRSSEHKTHVDWAFAALIGSIFFIYVGTETAVGGWIASYAKRIAPQSASMWAMMPSFFYGTLLAGRALAPLMLRTIREVTIALAGTVMAFLGVVALLGSHSIGMLILGSSLAGLGLSAVYPIKVSLLPRWFHERATFVGGFMFALGNLGGGTVPWLVGALSSRFSDLRTGFVVPLLGAASLIVFYSVQRQKLYRAL